MDRDQDRSATPFVPTDYHWLALRFAADRDSRDPDLLARVAASLADRPALRVLDLGAGAGANLLYLAPRLPAARQEWTLIDRDAVLVERVAACFDTFARELPGMTARPGRVAFDTAEVRYRATSGDFLRADCPIYDERYDLVVANAVFDLLSAAQFERFLALAASRWPAPRPSLYFTINLDRGLTFRPGAAADTDVIALFHAHMQREQAFGRAMGPDSAREMLRLLDAHGLVTRAAPSAWVASERDFLQANLNFFDTATREMCASGPGGGPDEVALASWLAHKRGLIDAGALTLEVAHQDIWATWDEPAGA